MLYGLGTAEGCRTGSAHQAVTGSSSGTSSESQPCCAAASQPMPQDGPSTQGATLPAAPFALGRALNTSTPAVASPGAPAEAGGRDGSAAASSSAVPQPGDPEPARPRRQLALARILLSRDKAAQALEVVEQALLGQPAQPDLQCLRGRCLAAQGDRAAAFASFAAVLTAAPAHADTLAALGALYQSCGLLFEAADVLRRARSANPSDGSLPQALAVVLTDLGTKHKAAGQLGQARAHYEEALAACASYAPAHYNIGVLHSEAAEYDQALACYERATAEQPHYAEALCNMGVIHKGRGDLQRAVDLYQQALAVAPNFQIVHSNLAIALTELATRVKVEGRLEEAVRLYERALAHWPRCGEALYNLGVALGEAGRPERAIFVYEAALAAAPECAEAWNNLGVLLREAGNLERAAHCYAAALHRRPNFPQGLNNAAVVLLAQGAARDAFQMLQAALLAAPDYAEAYNNLGVLLRDLGNIPDALAAYERCLALAPGSQSAGQNRLLALNYIHGGELPEVCKAHEEWGAQFQRLFTPLPPVPADAARCSPARPLVVGYVSPDLFTHSVSYFAEAPLSRHDPAAVRQIAYSCVTNPDARTARLCEQVLAAGGTWRSVARLTPVQLAQLVRDDQVDILVELTGHTANNRLAVCAMRPAPVQVTWIGYPNSTGLRAVDYRLTDSICDPESTQQTYTEELVRLPGCFLCYAPPLDAPAVAPLPAAEADFVTFGSFNNLAKITPQVMRTWARILAAVPTSRLVLKNKPFACAMAREHVTAALAREGVPASRVDLLPLAARTADHLATYAAVDIGLDPFPYAGTTTTCEALLMGVPTVTLTGACHAHNVGASLLTAVGLERDWVAHTEDEYVELAVRAANDISGLAALRKGLRERMLKAPLCDASTFVRQLERVYRQLFSRWVTAQQARGCSPARSTAEQSNSTDDTLTQDGQADDGSSAHDADCSGSPARSVG